MTIDERVPLTIKPGGDYICLCVKTHSPRPSILHSHHVWPLGEGGPNVRANLLWLCLPGDQQVTMADGSLRRIDAVRGGDIVFGHDGLPHHVTGVKVSSTDENIVRLDDLLLTADHLVLTRTGWLPAGALRKGDETCLLQPLSKGVESHVLSLVSAEPQVLRPVVVGDQVDMVHDLGGGQPPTDDLLHDEARPLHDATVSPLPYGEDDMPFVVEPSISLAFEGTGGSLEGCHPAGSATELRDPVRLDAPLLRCEGRFALLTREFDRRQPTQVRRAGGGAGCVPAGQRQRHLEVFIAGATRLHDEANVAPCKRRWNPLTHVERASHAGYLYDITVAGSQSFIAGGIAVHNCPTAHMNVHELWRLMDKLKGDVPTAQLRAFSRYVRGVVQRGWDQKTAAQPGGNP